MRRNQDNGWLFLVMVIFFLACLNQKPVDVPEKTDEHGNPTTKGPTTDDTKPLGEGDPSNIFMCIKPTTKGPTLDDTKPLGEGDPSNKCWTRIVKDHDQCGRLSSKYIPLLNQCNLVNPSVSFILWSDGRPLDPQGQDHQNLDMDENSLLSEVCHFFILHPFGGIHMDLDTRCLGSLPGVAHMEAGVLNKEAKVETMVLWPPSHVIMQSVIASVSDHFFFRQVVKGPNVLWLTGPFYLQDRPESYHLNLNQSRIYIPRV